ncbi:MAG: alkaline phosphatase family protein [Bacteroidetes bacterium]|nr:alkaline phosphatase family protein [Bacteroidota bacterium]
MKKLFLGAALATAAFVFMAQKPAQQPDSSSLPRAPKLVVGIVIDQMRYDYIYRYWDKFGNGGFKRLVNEGYFNRNTHYNYMPTETGPGHASIYTGTFPAVHGIVANRMNDLSTGNPSIYCVSDSSVTGAGTSSTEGKCSPRKMLTTTIGDQLRMNTIGKSKVIGIALKDRAAILPAGHSADTANGLAAYWYEMGTGKFISSSYYMKNLPAWVDAFNKYDLAAQYMSKPWTTLLAANQYTESLPDDNRYETVFGPLETRPVFPHPVDKLKGMDAYKALGRTPYGCNLTKDFALAAIKGENLGKRGVTDMLAVSFSSPDIIGHYYGPQSMEVEDTYLRLDKDLADLLNFIDNWVGKNNALVFLSADHGAVEVPQYLTDNHIPGGYFNDEVIADSLKRFYQRLYGDSSLLLTVDNYQVFLNRKQLAKHKLDAAEVQRATAARITQMNGIVGAVTASDLLSTQFTSGARMLIQNGWHPKRSGDVCYIPAPGWLAGWGKTGTSHGSPWSYDTHVPLLWWGWKIKPGQSDAHVNIVDIAPTVCQLIGIQMPNGTAGKPLEGLLR